jgi:ligand-binding sensor domain-containing protein/signal transduction histidine kinase
MYPHELAIASDESRTVPRSRRSILNLCESCAVRAASGSNPLPFLRLLARRAACMFLLVTIGACAAQSQLDLTSYTRRLWQAPDGLPEQTVQAFAQTHEGFLWIGTTGGLLRFDGAHFAIYDRQNTPALLENNIFILTVARDRALWIGTEGGGLARYSGGAFHSWSTRNANDGLSNDFVRSIAEAQDGTIWAGTDNGLLRLEGGRFIRVDGKGQIPQLAVHAILPEANGDLWAGGSRLLRIHINGKQGTEVHEFTLPGEASQNRVKSILRTRDGTLWVGTVSGLNRLVPGSDTFQHVAGLNATVRTLMQTADGILWIGTIGQGVYTLHGLSPASMTAQLGLPSNTVLSIFEDSERNLWMGAQTGMLRLAKSPLSVVPLPRPNDSDFGTVYLDRDNSLWIGSAALFRLRNGVVTQETLPGVGDTHVRNLFRDRSGVLWAGTDGDGLFRIAPGNTAHFTTRQGLANNFIRSIAQDRDGSIWAACDEGISHISGPAESPHIVSYQMRDGLAYFSTRVLLASRSGDLWIGTDSGLSHMRGGVFLSDAATQALAQSKIWAIHEDSDGGLWFGTRNSGLFRYRDGRVTHFTTADGLASNAIYQILEDSAGRLWLSGPGGISLFRRDDLDAHAESPAHPLAVTFFSLGELSGSVEIYGGTQPSGAITPEGEVWFPSSRGPLHIVPAARSAPAPPSVYFDSILAGGSPLPLAGPLQLAAGVTRIAFNYAPIRLRSQAGIRFRYRLEGFDRDWNPPTVARSAEYTNLPPGSYTFRVQAFEIDNPSAVSEAYIELVQQPHFYRTWWFLAIAAALIALLIYAVYRARVRQVQARFAGVLEERSRLAREMHDTVIQGCTSVSALLEAASMERDSGSGPNSLLEFARTQLRATIDEARDAIWNMRQPDADPNALGAKIARMTEQISAEFHVAIPFAASGTPFAVPQPVAHDLLMVAREAVHNAVLHGKPSLIRVQLNYARGELSLTIADNGSGFDLTGLQSMNDHHFGLKGMEERIHRTGGRFHIDATPHKGVVITVHVPQFQG